MDEVAGRFIEDSHDRISAPEGVDERQMAGGRAAVVVGLGDGDGPVGVGCAGLRELGIGIKRPGFEGDLAGAFVDAGDAVAGCAVVQVDGADAEGPVVVFV